MLGNTNHPVRRLLVSRSECRTLCQNYLTNLVKVDRYTWKVMCKNINFPARQLVGWTVKKKDKTSAVGQRIQSRACVVGRIYVGPHTYITWL